MHTEITDQDIQIAIERAHQFRAEAAADIGKGIKSMTSKLIASVSHAVRASLSPSKPQH